MHAIIVETTSLVLTMLRQRQSSARLCCYVCRDAGSHAAWVYIEKVKAYGGMQVIIVEHRQEAASLKGELATLKKRYLERKRREQQAAASAPAQALAAGANPGEVDNPILPARNPAGGMDASPDGAGRLHVQGETSPRGRAVEHAATLPRVAAAHAPSGSVEAGTLGSGASESSAAEASPALAATAEQAPGCPVGAAPGVGLEEGAASGSPVAVEGTPGMQPERPDVRWWATDAVAYPAAAGGALGATTGTAVQPADTDRPPRVPG